MAITSTFYDTTPGNGITETEWAQNRFGAPAYGVAGANDWKVTAVAGQDRTVTIAAGKGFGWGIADESDANETRQFGAVAGANGTVRWDLVVAHRDWQPAGGGPTTFNVIAGSSAQSIPAGRVNNPGIVDDQPIALVELIAGQTGVGRIIDLRCWAANGGVLAVDKLALDYLNVPGADVHIGGLDYRYKPDSLGVFGWESRETMFREWNAVTTVTVTEAANGTKNVSFPAGYFTVPPLVQATKQSGTLAKYIPYVSNITASGCVVGLYSGDASGSGTTASIPVYIQAVQTAPNRAGGI